MGAPKKKVAAPKPGRQFVAAKLPTNGLSSENGTRRIGMKSNGDGIVPSLQRIPTRRSTRRHVPKIMEFSQLGKNPSFKSKPIPKTKPASKASKIPMVNQISEIRAPKRKRYADDTATSTRNLRSKINRAQDDDSLEETGIHPGLNPNDFNMCVQIELARFQSEVNNIHHAFEKAFFQFKINILDQTVEQESSQSKVFRFQQTLEPPEDPGDVDDESFSSPDLRGRDEL